MTLEQRGRQTYLYRSVRTADGRVRKLYLGHGAVAKAAAQEAAQAKVRQQADEQATLDLQLTMAPLDAVAQQLDAGLNVLTRASLLVKGFHEHKGAWRRRRDETPTNH